MCIKRAFYLLTFSHYAILLFILCQKNSLKVRNIQLNLSAMATLQTEESGHCGEVKTRVNV